MGTEIGRQGNNYFCSVFKIIYLNDLIGGFCVGRHVAPLGHNILILSQPVFALTP